MEARGGGGGGRSWDRKRKLVAINCANLGANTSANTVLLLNLLRVILLRWPNKLASNSRQSRREGEGDERERETSLI